MAAPQELVERALALSRSDACVVIADESSSANLRWANNTLTTNGVTHSRLLTVIATINGTSGTAVGVGSRSGITKESLEALVRAAEAAARSGPAAQDARPLMAPYEPSPHWDDPPIETSIGVFSCFAPALAEALARARSEGRLMFGYAQHTSQSTYIGASTGLRLRHVQPSGYIQVNAKSRDYAQSAWAGAMSTDFTDGEIGVLEAQLTERLQWSRKQVGLPAGRYETLLPPAVVADLMLYTYNSLGARDAQDGRSVFSKPGGTRIGERLAHTPITMRSDPAAVGLECAPFVIAYTSSGMSSVFDNGFPLQPTSWVQDGTLSALVQTRHSAQLTGLPVTPQIDNLIVEGPPGGPSLTGLIESTARGLLLTSIWYIREVDPRTLLLTGLTRDGVFLIEAGEVVGAVNNFRFNESPVDLLGRVSEIGATTRTLAREWGSYFMRTAMPALRVSDFNMSSTSEAS